MARITGRGSNRAVSPTTRNAEEEVKRYLSSFRATDTLPVSVIEDDGVSKYVLNTESPEFLDQFMSITRFPYMDGPNGPIPYVADQVNSMSDAERMDATRELFTFRGERVSLFVNNDVTSEDTVVIEKIPSPFVVRQIKKTVEQDLNLFFIKKSTYNEHS